VRRPGTYELPLGISLREILEEHCGGMSPGYALRGVIPGGGSTPIVAAAEWEVAMDFTSLAEIGSRLGTGGIIVLDDRTCLVGVLRNLEHFYGQESCGWCTPCREGLPYVEHILAGLEEGRGAAGDVELLDELCAQIGPNSFCALADGAIGPLASALAKFRGEFERHVTGKGCPYEPPEWGSLVG
jgi:NADH-quinone oxidoreductase subunit F